MDERVTIEILNQAFTFKSEFDTARTQEVIDYLLKEVTKVEGQLKNQSTHISKLAILLLAALNIVNEHFECKNKYALVLENISNRSDHLIRLLDRDGPVGEFAMVKPGTDS